MCYTKTILPVSKVLTLSENEGHKGQKGQFLKNVANCLKRMQNKNFL